MSIRSVLLILNFWTWIVASPSYVIAADDSPHIPGRIEVDTPDNKISPSLDPDQVRAPGYMTAGMAMGVIGGVIAGVGAVFVGWGWYANETVDPEAPTMGGGIGIITGLVIIGLSLPLIIGGILLYYTGKKRLKSQDTLASWFPTPSCSYHTVHSGRVLGVGWSW